MIPLLHLTATLTLCTLLVRPLSTARWMWRAPLTGIVLWQLLAAAWVLSALGTLLTVALLPYHPDIPGALSAMIADLVAGELSPAMGPPHRAALAGTAFALFGLLIAFGSRLLSVLRTRRRHRDLLALVAHEDPAAPGALVLDHPLAMAYCLPGWKPAVVLSSGALDALDREELGAVLAHERSHAAERHDLVLLPFAALRGLLRSVPPLRAVPAAVALLIEMRADDEARAEGAAGPLAAALRRFSTAGATVPHGAIGAVDVRRADAVAVRLERIDADRGPLPVVLRVVALSAGVLLLWVPIALMTAIG